MVKYVDYSKKDFYQMILRKDVVCFGAGPMFQETLKHLDIAERIVALLDNNQALWGTKISTKDRTWYVQGIEYLKFVDTEKIILLLTSRFYESIYRQLKLCYGEKEFVVTVFPWIQNYLSREEDPLGFYQTRIMTPAKNYYRE